MAVFLLASLDIHHIQLISDVGGLHSSSSKKLLQYIFNGRLNMADTGSCTRFVFYTPTDRQFSILLLM